MLCHDAKLTEEFETLLSSFPDHHFCEGTTNLPQIYINGQQDPLQYPIDSDTVSQLKQHATKSKFGRGTQTIYDEATRVSFELNSTQFTLANFELTSTKSVLLESVRKRLMPHIDFILAEPYKLILYEKGCFFSKHKDHQSSPLHFGSLVVLLPHTAGYKGGDFILQKANSKTSKQFVWNVDERTHRVYTQREKCPFIAFYTDINHEIKAVTQGVRISLVFQLFINEKFFRDFNKYNQIALNNNYKCPPKSKKEYLQIKHNAKTGLKKIRKIRGLLSRFGDGYNTEVYETLINDELLSKIVTKDISKIIASYLIYVDDKILDQMVNIIRKHEWQKNRFKWKYVQFEQDDGKDYTHDCSLSFLIVFQYEYSGKIIHPLLLKGRDLFIYAYFQKYLFVHPLAVSINLNKMQYSPYNEEEDGIECEPFIGLGNRYQHVETPAFLGQIDSYNQVQMLYIGEKEQTLSELMYVARGKDHDLGNEGVYQEWDVYHISGLLMRPFFPNETHNLFTEQYFQPSS